MADGISERRAAQPSKGSIRDDCGREASQKHRADPRNSQVFAKHSQAASHHPEERSSPKLATGDNPLLLNLALFNRFRLDLEEGRQGRDRDRVRAPSGILPHPHLRHRPLSPQMHIRNRIRTRARTWREQEQEAVGPWCCEFCAPSHRSLPLFSFCLLCFVLRPPSVLRIPHHEFELAVDFEGNLEGNFETYWRSSSSLMQLDTRSLPSSLSFLLVLSSCFVILEN
ncbi:hypothetical protein C8R45DRAFT_1073737 [Mycena sanguinolenta]|nr:hypothetical protein C8R45DRAFT_1073737 [Mycena sanguinolenta]